MYRRFLIVTIQVQFFIQIQNQKTSSFFKLPLKIVDRKERRNNKQYQQKITRKSFQKRAQKSTIINGVTNFWKPYFWFTNIFLTEFVTKSIV